MWLDVAGDVVMEHHDFLSPEGSTFVCEFVSLALKVDFCRFILVLSSFILFRLCT
jgi:hypothetical protein